jgi:hypothetical protein
MNKEAEINKELIKVLEDKIQLLEEQKANSQEIINAQKEQLILSGVSNRRELLISFKDFYNKKMEEYALHCGIDIALIDEFERNL